MDTKRKIAFVMGPLIVGGVEKAIIELLQHIDYSRYDVTLYLENDSGAWKNRINSNTKIEYWNMISTKKLILTQLQKLKLFSVAYGVFFRIMARLNYSNYLLNGYYSQKCLPNLCDESFDCVIAYQAYNPLVVSVALNRLRSKKKIAWIHGEWDYTGRNAQLFTRLFEKFSDIICVSHSIKNYFNTYYLRHNNTHVIYNLLDKLSIKTKSMESHNVMKYGQQNIVTVGRLANKKGQQMIPATARMLVDAGYDIYWYLIGDGPLREEIEREIEKHNVSNHVILLGTKNNPYPYIKNCDIYVQPSFSEGYCTTTIEAKILQKPIVTTDAPGMCEQFVSGENGLIVDTMTPEALFEGIKTLLAHPEIRQKFVENLKNEEYNNTKELQKLYDIIES
ncbi:MAG: glycosyltransferase [Ruminococcaceae bacterium]|nr:glycosyltransferase [Oscillospiraceae bacterium]